VRYVYPVDEHLNVVLVSEPMGERETERIARLERILEIHMNNLAALATGDINGSARRFSPVHRRDVPRNPSGISFIRTHRLPSVILNTGDNSISRIVPSGSSHTAIRRPFGRCS
jgi:hypothetical protein